MRSREKAAERLLNAAAEDVRTLHRKCVEAGEGRPVVFLVLLDDSWGRAFTDAFVPPARIDEMLARRAIGTYLHPMPLVNAIKAMNRMNVPGMRFKQC